MTRVKFQDSKENTITESLKDTVTYDKRIGTYISSFGLYHQKEGEEVHIFTENNLDKFIKHHNDEVIKALTESLETKKQMIELMKLLKELDGAIKKLKSDKEKLQKLNKQLSETIKVLKK